MVNPDIFNDVPIFALLDVDSRATSAVPVGALITIVDAWESWRASRVARCGRFDRHSTIILAEHIAITVLSGQQTDHFEIAQSGIVSIRSGIAGQPKAESAVKLDRCGVVTGHGQSQSSRALGTSPCNYCID
jgi:hypothetical protein